MFPKATWDLSLLPPLRTPGSNHRFSTNQLSCSFFLHFPLLSRFLHLLYWFLSANLKPVDYPLLLRSTSPPHYFIDYWTWTYFEIFRIHLLLHSSFHLFISIIPCSILIFTISQIFICSWLQTLLCKQPYAIASIKMFFGYQVHYWWLTYLHFLRFFSSMHRHPCWQICWLLVHLYLLFIFSFPIDHRH